MDISELLAFVVKNKASDLHLSAGLPPMIRVHGDIRRINLPAMEHKDVHGMIYDIMNHGHSLRAAASGAVCAHSFRGTKWPAGSRQSGSSAPGAA